MEYLEGIIKERKDEENKTIFFIDQLFNVSEIYPDLRPRSIGNFKDTSFYLPRILSIPELNYTGVNVSWHIIQDDRGELVLVPKRKD